YPERSLTQLPVFVVAGAGGGTGVIGVVPFASEVTTGVLCAVLSLEKGQACAGITASTAANAINEAISFVMGDLRPCANASDTTGFPSPSRGNVRSGSVLRHYLRSRNVDATSSTHDDDAAARIHDDKGGACQKRRSACCWPANPGSRRRPTSRASTSSA